MPCTEYIVESDYEPKIPSPVQKEKSQERRELVHAVLSKIMHFYRAHGDTGVSSLKGSIPGYSTIPGAICVKLAI